MAACDFGAGWFGAIASISIGHPMDTLKVRVQASKGVTASEAFKKCLKTEGVGGFFKGLSYPLMASGVVNAFLFGAYGFTLDQIAGEHNAKPSTLQHFAAGCVAGVAQLSVACPVDVVKIKLQMQQSKPHAHHRNYQSPLAVLGAISKRHGLRGVYRGSLAMGMRDCFSSGLYFASYSYMVDQMGCSSFTAGGIAGVVSWVPAMPFDVVKSRLQADSIVRPRFNGITDCFVKTYKEGGLRIFSRGVMLVSLRAFPVNGACFMGAEWYRKGCGQYW